MIEKTIFSDKIIKNCSVIETYNIYIYIIDTLFTKFYLSCFNVHNKIPKLILSYNNSFC